MIMQKMTEFTKEWYDASIFKIAQFLIIDHDLKESDLSGSEIAIYINKYIIARLATRELPPFIMSIRFSRGDILESALTFAAHHTDTDNLDFGTHVALLHRAILGADIADTIQHELLKGAKQL